MSRLAIWIAVFLLLPFRLLAQELPQPLTDRVSDYDGLLPEAAEARLSDSLAQVRAETGVHVVLVVLDRREAHGGQGRSIEDYAKALFNRWGVGDRGRDDGVMILVAAGDREMRIQLGAGFGPEWDGVAQGVIDTAFLPALRRGDTAAAVETGTAAVIDRIARPFAAGDAPAAAKGGGKSWGLFFPLILLAGIGLAARHLIGRLLLPWRVCPGCGQRGSLARQRSETMGTEVLLCSHCGFREERGFSASKGSGRSGGGFGGGRSSGGGATGRW